MSERMQDELESEIEEKSTDKYLVDETPELRHSWQRKRDHQPDHISSGYDPYGETRVGIGSADGDVERLVLHNEGRHRSDGNHSVREAARDKIRITESFCSHLGVTSYQQSEALSAIGRLNLDRFGQQKRLEKVALAVIKVVVERDRFHRLRDSNLANLDGKKMPERMTANEKYCDLLDKYAVSREDLFSISQIVKRELKKQQYFAEQQDSEAGDDQFSSTE